MAGADLRLASCMFLVHNFVGPHPPRANLFASRHIVTAPAACSFPPKQPRSTTAYHNVARQCISAYTSTSSEINACCALQATLAWHQRMRTSPRPCSTWTSCCATPQRFQRHRRQQTSSGKSWQTLPSSHEPRTDEALQCRSDHWHRWQSATK
jgi:hypothetical protein